MQYAVAIIEEKSLTEVKSEDYGEVFNRYLKYKEDGLIAFTTFHQSFGYEEFMRVYARLCLQRKNLKLDEN